MALEIRPITGEEFVAYNNIDSAAFGTPVDTPEIEARRPIFEFDRSLAAFADGEMVGSAGAYTFELTLPGGTTLSVPGVTWVAVLPTYRRRGILTAMMRRQLDDFRERGEAVAVLTASESLIYSRFGYGMATSQVWYEIDRRHAAFRAPFTPAEQEGRVRLITHERAIDVYTTFYDRWRRTQPGAVGRGRAYWEFFLRNPLAPVDGSGGRLYLMYESAAGAVEGIAHYRKKNTWEDGAPSGVVTVRDLLTTTRDAYTGLWRYLLTLDLVRTVQAPARPPDEPLRWMLADSRRLRTTRVVDDLWARILDVPAALTARRYLTTGRLVFEISDGFRAETAGRYALDASAAGAECARTDAGADLALDIADLGAAYLGGVRFTTLARAGRVRELRPGALRRADALFASDPEPWCGTSF
ncbi:MAG TPA: GNAT family N-acetyltransferase [Ktedonobacterales bacterium]|nr:GNAT family N-acetyltransferase [Ktedonobacterales bacterium]